MKIIMNLFQKFNARQFGILLIVIGVFIPSILYPFTSLTNEAQEFRTFSAYQVTSYNTNLRDLEIVIFNERIRIYDKDIDRIVLPYKYPLSFGILLVFIGIGFVVLCKNTKLPAIKLWMNFT